MLVYKSVGKLQEVIKALADLQDSKLSEALLHAFSIEEMSKFASYPVMSYKEIDALIHELNLDDESMKIPAVREFIKAVRNASGISNNKQEYSLLQEAFRRDTLTGVIHDVSSVNAIKAQFKNIIKKMVTYPNNPEWLQKEAKEFINLIRTVKDKLSVQSIFKGYELDLVYVRKVLTDYLEDPHSAINKASLEIQEMYKNTIKMIDKTLEAFKVSDSLDFTKHLNEISEAHKNIEYLTTTEIETLAKLSKLPDSADKEARAVLYKAFFAAYVERVHIQLQELSDTLSKVNRIQYMHALSDLFELFSDSSDGLEEMRKIFPKLKTVDEMSNITVDKVIEHLAEHMLAEKITLDDVKLYLINKMVFNTRMIDPKSRKAFGVEDIIDHIYKLDDDGNPIWSQSELQNNVMNLAKIVAPIANTAKPGSMLHAVSIMLSDLFATLNEDQVQEALDILNVYKRTITNYNALISIPKIKELFDNGLITVSYIAGEFVLDVDPKYADLSAVKDFIIPYFEGGMDNFGWYSQSDINKVIDQLTNKDLEDFTAVVPRPTYKYDTLMQNKARNLLALFGSEKFVIKESMTPMLFKHEGSSIEIIKSDGSDNVMWVYDSETNSIEFNSRVLQLALVKVIVKGDGTTFVDPSSTKTYMIDIGDLKIDEEVSKNSHRLTNEDFQNFKKQAGENYQGLVDVDFRGKKVKYGKIKDVIDDFEKTTEGAILWAFNGRFDLERLVYEKMLLAGKMAVDELDFNNQLAENSKAFLKNHILDIRTLDTIYIPQDVAGTRNIDLARMRQIYKVYSDEVESEFYYYDRTNRVRLTAEQYQEIVDKAKKLRWLESEVESLKKYLNDHPSLKGTKRGDTLERRLAKLELRIQELKKNGKFILTDGKDGQKYLDGDINRPLHDASVDILLSADILANDIMTIFQVPERQIIAHNKPIKEEIEALEQVIKPVQNQINQLEYSFIEEFRAIQKEIDMTSDETKKLILEAQQKDLETKTQKQINELEDQIKPQRDKLKQLKSSLKKENFKLHNRPADINSLGSNLFTETLGNVIEVDTLNLYKSNISKIISKLEEIYEGDSDDFIFGSSSDTLDDVFIALREIYERYIAKDSPAKFKDMELREVVDLYYQLNDLYRIIKAESEVFGIETDIGNSLAPRETKYDIGITLKELEDMIEDFEGYAKEIESMNSIMQTKYPNIDFLQLNSNYVNLRLAQAIVSEEFVKIRKVIFGEYHYDYPESSPYSNSEMRILSQMFSDPDVSDSKDIIALRELFTQLYDSAVFTLENLEELSSIDPKLIYIFYEYLSIVERSISKTQRASLKTVVDSTVRNFIEQEIPKFIKEGILDKEIPDVQKLSRILELIYNTAYQQYNAGKPIILTANRNTINHLRHSLVTNIVEPIQVKRPKSAAITEEGSTKTKYEDELVVAVKRSLLTPLIEMLREPLVEAKKYKRQYHFMDVNQFRTDNIKILEDGSVKVEYETALMRNNSIYVPKQSKNVAKSQKLKRKIMAPSKHLTSGIDPTKAYPRTHVNDTTMGRLVNSLAEALGFTTEFYVSNWYKSELKSAHNAALAMLFDDILANRISIKLAKSVDFNLVRVTFEEARESLKRIITDPDKLEEQIRIMKVQFMQNLMKLDISESHSSMFEHVRLRYNLEMVDFVNQQRHHTDNIINMFMKGDGSLDTDGLINFMNKRKDEYTFIIFDK